jgi:L-fucose isomerase-like protein
VAVPGDAAKALQLKEQVDGYLVYVITLNWNLGGALAQIGELGKPLLLADEFLGGCGLFLCCGAALRRAGVAVARVSTTRAADLAAVARRFADLREPGLSPAAFAQRCEETYRRTLAARSSRKCLADKVPLTDTDECIKRLKASRFLIVGAGNEGREADFLGIKGIYAGFDEFQVAYDKVDRDEAAEWGRKWSGQAERVIEPTPEWIAKAGAMYLAMLQVMKRHGADSITMNCLGGFNAGKLPAYPCLGFRQILDDGGQGVCEAMPDDSVSSLMARVLTGRPGYVSDPALDTSQNQIVYAHCMATTRVFGPQGPASRFRIRTLHNRDPRGTCAQSFLPEGYMTTSFRTSVWRKQMVIHQARAAGNLDRDRGCRTQLVGEVIGDITKLFDQWDQFSWHRVTVYGDLLEPLTELGKALGLEVIKEA